MGKSEVVTLRISEEVKEKLKKVFGEGVTTSDMIRNTISTYLENISKFEKGIVSMDIPINLLKGDDLRNLYNDICQLENKVTENIIKLGYDYDLDYLEVIQNAKKILVSHMSIEYGRKEIDKSIDRLKEKIEK